MMMRSLVMGGLLLIGAAAGWGFSAATGEAAGDGDRSAVLATVGGTKLTQAEIEGIEPEKFLSLTRQRHALTEHTLEQAIRLKLVEVEAEERGLRPGELVEQEVYSKIQDPTPEAIDSVYRLSGSTAPRDAAVPQIRSMLRRKAQTERYDDYLEELKKKHAVEIRMGPFRSEVASAGYPGKGAREAPVTIVEFSDFQCPYCAKMAPVVDQFLAAYGDQVRFVYRHLPLNIHPQANKAAEASLCAHEQDRFWEMHDAMFADQRALAIADLKNTARSLGMDGAKFDECLDSGRHAEAVAADAEAARKLGITGTPAFFVNGRLLAGSQDAASFETMILDELGRAGLPAERRRIEPIRVDVASAGFPARGPADAPVTIVEFADFQCPFCKQIVGPLEQVVAHYGDQVRFVYRQYPIPALHPQAPKAAEAALCAHAQDRFWEMHDAMFANPQDLAPATLKAMARDVGVKGAEFDRCLDSGDFADEVAADVAAARAAGANGTPALFINGRFLSGMQNYAALAAVIEEELADAKR